MSTGSKPPRRSSLSCSSPPASRIVNAQTCDPWKMATPWSVGAARARTATRAS
jgi:hypothetical protein